MTMEKKLKVVEVYDVSLTTGTEYLPETFRESGLHFDKNSKCLYFVDKDTKAVIFISHYESLPSHLFKEVKEEVKGLRRISL